MHGHGAPYPGQIARLGFARYGSGMQTGSAEVRGVTYVYVDAGPGDGPLALVLHGFPDSPVSMSGIVEQLAAMGHHVVAPWIRGFAPTSLAPDASYHVGSLAADANALHEALGGDERAVIVGHDWGAPATYAALAVEPNRWRRGVTLSVPPGSLMLDAMARVEQLQRSWYMWLFQTPLAEGALAANDLALVDHLWSQWSPGLDASVSAEPIAAAKQALRGPGHLEAALSYYRSLFAAPPADEAARRAQDHTYVVGPVPVCYVHGADDGCITLPEGCDPLVHLAEGSAYVSVPGAGHFVHLERPDAVASAITDFLEA